MKGKLTLELQEDAYFFFDRHGELKGVRNEVIDRENTYKLPKGNYKVDKIQGKRVFLIDIDTKERSPIMLEDYIMLVNHLEQ